MPAQRFRKKPVDEIEAMQFVITGDSDADMALVDSIMRWAISHATDPSISGSLAGDDPHMLISTLEGEMKALPGDWIIHEPFPTSDRHFYPCKPDIFDATYEAVVSGQRTVTITPNGDGTDHVTIQSFNDTGVFSQTMYPRCRITDRADGVSIDVLGIPNKIPPIGTAPDTRPHSRACGIRAHEHGVDCNPNCPTCGGRPMVGVS